jgi:hypothetical protein
MWMSGSVIFTKKPSWNQVVTTEHRGVRQPHSFVKINVDAVFHQSRGSGVWGAIDSIALQIFALHPWQWTLCKAARALSNTFQIEEQLGVGKQIASIFNDH